MYRRYTEINARLGGFAIRAIYLLYFLRIFLPFAFGCWAIWEAIGFLYSKVGKFLDVGNIWPR